MRDRLRPLVCRVFGHRWRRRWSMTGWRGMRDTAGFICTRCTAYEVREL